MPMGELPPEYLAQLHGGPSTSGMMTSHSAHYYPPQQQYPHPGMMTQHYPHHQYPSMQHTTQKNTWDSDEESTDDE